MDTVLAHGCFDLLHLGHIRHLNEARSLGDRLVVSLTADNYVRKGTGRPQFSVEQRREALLHLGCVDEVVISEAETAVDVIRRLRPAVYVKGVDYIDREDDGLAAERAAVEEIGGRFHVTTAEKWSSTKLLRELRLPDAALAYLERARGQGFLEEILAAFKRADDQRIIFVGETIIDEYRYVKPLAKPSKESILATVAAGSEGFFGGIVAAAKHCDWSDVHVVTSNSVITKTRFVGSDFHRKLFEVYSSVDIEEVDRDEVRTEMMHQVHEADIVVAIDFGHGLFGRHERDLIQQAKFLALTAQSNAGNYGFNPVTRHRRADYVVVDEPEARLAVADGRSSHEDVAEAVANTMFAPMLTVTRGRHGSVSRQGGGKSVGWANVPAFTEGGLDTMGAGDAFIAVAAPLVAVGLELEMAAFAGNVAGGLKTTILGHRRHVGRDDLVKNIEWLLK